MSENIVEKRVLALKYRPKRFEDLIGQTTISQTLSLALDSNRLSHAYLFSGLRGSGKTSTARIMAKALLCSEGPTSKPCDICENCVSANTNRHLDIIEMDAASNRGIDDIKDLIEHTKYKPSSARFKVFIIDEVHMLTTQAFNALLKTLEEPPGFVKFILATTDPLKLPATILSRTQHFRFNKIAQNDVIHHLSHILNEENIPFETPALDVLARTGQGSLRDTLTLLDQAIIFSKGSVNINSVVDMLGLIEPKLMDDIFDVVLNKGDINPIIAKLENYEISQVCDEMVLYLKDKMISKNPKFDLMLFDRFFRIISDSKHLLAINADGGFVLILTLMKMMEATNLKTIDEIINQVEKIPASKEESQVVQISKPAPAIDAQEVKPEIKEEVKEEPIVEKVTPKVVQEIKTIQDEVKEKQQINLNAGLTPFDDGFVVQASTSTPKEELATPENLDIQIPSAVHEVIEEIPSLENMDLNVEYQDEYIEEETNFEPMEPIKQEITQNDPGKQKYELLINKLYDRDIRLGECFEDNFIYNGYKDNILAIISKAQGEQRAFLYKHFSLIKTFTQDIYGLNVELDFQKAADEEVKTIEKTAASTNAQTTQEIVNEQSDEDSTGSMIEEIEMSSGCVADMHKNSNPTPAQKELQIDDILNSKMLDKAKELFDIKKITVKTRS